MLSRVAINLVPRLLCVGGTRAWERGWCGDVMLYLAKNLEVVPFILLSMDWRLEHSQGCVSTACFSVHMGLISAKFDQGPLPPPSPMCLLSVHLTSHMIRPGKVDSLFLISARPF